MLISNSDAMKTQHTNIYQLLALLFFSAIFTSTAQEKPSFEWSQYYNTTSIGMLNPKLDLASDQGFVTYSVEPIPNKTFGNHIYIQSFDAACKIIADTKVALPILDAKEAIYLNTLSTANQLLIFSYLPVKGKSNTLFVQVYTFGQSKISAPKTLVSFPIEKTSNSGDFLFAVSEDNQSIGVVAHLPQIKKGQEQLTFHLFDANTLNELEKKDVSLNYKSKKAYDEVLYLTNDKKGLLVKTVDKNKTTPKTVIVSLQGNQEVTANELPTDDFFVITSKIVETTKGPMLLGFATDLWKGAVANTDRKSKYAFLYDITTQKTLIKHAWTKEVSKKFLGKGFTHLTLKNVIVDQNNIYLIGDRYKEDATAIPGKSFEYDYEYFNGPGIVVKFNVTGELLYESYFEYSQRFKNREQQIGSFYPTLIDGKLHLFSSINMTELSDKLITMDHGEYTLNHTIIDDQGNQVSTPIFDDEVGGKKSSANFCPNTLIKASNTTFYTKAIGSGNQTFGKMILKN